MQYNLIVVTQRLTQIVAILNFDFSQYLKIHSIWKVAFSNTKVLSSRMRMPSKESHMVSNGILKL